MFRIVVPIGSFRCALLQVAGVRKHDAAQIARGAGAVNPPLETVLNEKGQIAGVIDVCMCQHHRVEGIDVERQRLPVAQSQLLEALKEPAVDQNSVLTGVQQLLGAGDCACRAQERELRHGVSSVIASARSEPISIALLGCRTVLVVTTRVAPRESASWAPRAKLPWMPMQTALAMPACSRMRIASSLVWPVEMMSSTSAGVRPRQAEKSWPSAATE